MVKKSFVVCLLVSAAVTIHAVGQDLDLAYQREYFHSSKGFELPYRILFPEGYDGDQPYPLIVFLHGAGERGTDNEKQLVHGATLFTREDIRRDYPAIVIFPQCPEGGYWSSVEIDRTKNPYDLKFDYEKPPTLALEAVAELVEEISSLENVDKDRRYIMGLSMGGMGTFEMVYRYPKLFAAAAPICGGGNPDQYDKRVKQVAFWLFHGDADAVVGVDESRQMNQRLQKLKVAELRYTEYPGVNHNSWDSAFAEPELLPWMFSKRR